MSRTVTVSQVSEFLAQSRQQLARGDSRFDLSELTHIDSSVLAALLSLSRECKSGRCEFVNPSENLRKLAGLYDVDTLLFKQ